MRECRSSILSRKQSPRAGRQNWALYEKYHCRTTKEKVNEVYYIDIIFIMLTGCFHNAAKVTGDPTKTITLEEAFRSVGASMVALEEAKGDKLLGIATSEVLVTFNISSTATDSSKLAANAGATSKATTSNSLTVVDTANQTAADTSESTSTGVVTGANETVGSKSSSSDTQVDKSTSSAGSASSTTATNVNAAGTEVGSSVGLSAEIGSTIQGNRSNLISIKLQSLPALLASLKPEHIALLKEIGYFQENQIEKGESNHVLFSVLPNLSNF